MASLFLINRNQLEDLYSHNAWYFCIMLYLRSNSMLTAALFEGLAYGEMALYQTTSVVYNGAFIYFVAVPAVYLLQIFLLGADLQVHVPSTLDGLLWDKRHVSGWVPVDLRRGLDPADPHW